MTIGINRKLIRSGAPLALLLVLALVLVPVGASAQQPAAPDSGVQVCNTAGPAGQGGDLVSQGDPQGALHNASGLKAMGNGNVNAAMHSRALSLCAEPATGYATT